MKRIVLLLYFILLCQFTWAQSSLSGRILDKAELKPLTNATIVLLNQDSILQHFTRADEDGNFNFKKVINQEYILIVSYPKFELYSQALKVDKNTTLPPIQINSQANLIEEVIVQQRLPIRIKGDTIEYNAASFETEKNAKLEDLLRRLPGLSVSGSGDITAHGKSVSKVLIDGQEFFGYDPKIAIRNVRADAVDKVQVYERKSEEAELTGIDDGVRIQTVNVVLKEEARKGLFGNVEAMYGSSDLYAANLFAAKFNQTERFGITANTNNMGGTGSGREGNLRYNSQIYGDPKNTSVGANYENQFFKRNLNVNANYNYNNGSNRNERTNYNKEIIPNLGVQETNSSSASENSNFGHNIQSRFRARLDSTSNLEFHVSGRINESQSASSSESFVTNENGEKVRDFSNNSTSNNKSNSNDIRINYRKRLNANGRNINLHLSNNNSQSEGNNDVLQNTLFHKNDSTVIINQNRLSENTNNNINGQFQFSDRINKKLNYAIGYNINNYVGNNLTNSYNKDPNSTQLTLDSLYSQNQTDKNTNQGIITNLNYNGEKVNINFSNRTNHKSQRLEDTYRQINLDRTFWDNDLNMSVNYKISNRKNVNLSYQNNFNIPTFNQLQPIQPQNNPVFIQLGNPDLKRSANNNIRANFNSMSLLKGTSWNINTNVRFTSNPIVNKREIDENAVTTSTYVNVNDKKSWSANLNSNYSMPIFDKKVQFNAFSGFNYNNGFTYIRYTTGQQSSTNYELNNLQNTNGNIGFSVNEQNATGLDFDINWRVSLNNQKNSIQQNLNYTSFNTGGSGYLRLFLPKQFNVTSQVTYSIEGPTKLYNESIQQFFTNFEVSKKLLKSQSLVASIKAYDIFNTYNNINRSVSDTNFSESTQLILTRYVLFGLKWDFNKNLGKKND